MIDLLERLKGRRRLTVIVVVVLVIAISWSEFVDRKSQNYVNSATFQAIGAFATARLLNAGITVAKSVQVGAGVSFQPLEVLDPVHDLVEQYSSIMKLSIGSLVTQKLLLEIVSSTFFKTLLTTLGLILIASLYVEKGLYSPLLLKLFALAGLVRFLFVFAVACNALVDEAYVNPKTEKNMAELEILSREINHFEVGVGVSLEERETLETQLEALLEDREKIIVQIEKSQRQVELIQEERKIAQSALENIDSQLSFATKINPFSKNLVRQNAQADFNEVKENLNAELRDLEKIKSHLQNIDKSSAEIRAMLAGEGSQRWFSSFSSRFSSFRDFARVDNLKERIEAFIPAMLNLMALFVFKTLIMPLLFLFLLLRGFRYIWGVDLREFVKAEVANVAAELKMDKKSS